MELSQVFKSQVLFSCQLCRLLSKHFNNCAFGLYINIFRIPYFDSINSILRHIWHNIPHVLVIKFLMSVLFVSLTLFCFFAHMCSAYLPTFYFTSTVDKHIMKYNLLIYIPHWNIKKIIVLIILVEQTISRDSPGRKVHHPFGTCLRHVTKLAVDLQIGGFSRIPYH